MPINQKENILHAKSKLKSPPMSPNYNSCQKTATMNFENDQNHDSSSRGNALPLRASSISAVKRRPADGDTMDASWIELDFAAAEKDRRDATGPTLVSDESFGENSRSDEPPCEDDLDSQSHTSSSSTSCSCSTFGGGDDDDEYEALHASSSMEMNYHYSIETTDCNVMMDPTSLHSNIDNSVGELEMGKNSNNQDNASTCSDLDSFANLLDDDDIEEDNDDYDDPTMRDKSVRSEITVDDIIEIGGDSFEDDLVLKKEEDGNAESNGKDPAAARKKESSKHKRRPRTNQSSSSKTAGIPRKVSTSTRRHRRRNDTMEPPKRKPSLESFEEPKRRQSPEGIVEPPKRRQSLRRKKSTRKMAGDPSGDSATKVRRRGETQRIRSKSSTSERMTTKKVRSKSSSAADRTSNNDNDIRTNRRRRKKREPSFVDQDASSPLSIVSFEPLILAFGDTTTKSCPNTPMMNLSVANDSSPNLKPIPSLPSTAKPVRRRRRDVLSKEKSRLLGQETVENCRNKSARHYSKVILQKERSVSDVVGMRQHKTMGSEKSRKLVANPSAKETTDNSNNSSRRKTKSAHPRMVGDEIQNSGLKKETRTPSLRLTRTCDPTTATQNPKPQAGDNMLSSGSDHLSVGGGSNHSSYVTAGLKKLTRSYYEAKAPQARSGEITISPTRAKSQIEKSVLLQNGGLSTGSSHDKDKSSSHSRNPFREIRDRAVTRAKSLHNITHNITQNVTSSATSAVGLSSAKSFLSSRKERQKKLHDSEHRRGIIQNSCSLYACMEDEEDSLDIDMECLIPASNEIISSSHIRQPPRRIKSLPLGAKYTR